MTTEILVARGLIAVVDDGDAPLVSRFTWHAIPDNRTTYAGSHTTANARRDLPGTRLMHRIVLGEPAGHVDHINGNGLDNRRANLRLATPSQNGANRRADRGGTSRFKGVSWHKRSACWMAYITVNRRRKYLGQFAIEADAALAYDEAARTNFGDFARLNLPRAGERPAFPVGAPS